MTMIRYGFVSPSLVFIMLFVLITSLGWSHVAHSETAPSADGHSRKLGAKAKKAESSTSSRERAGFIAKDETFLGTIYHSMGEAYLLRTGDIALIDVGANQELQVGDYLTVFGSYPVVRHVHTGALVGRPVRALGNVVVMRVEDATATIRITEVFDEIAVGDHVERFGVLPPAAPTVESPVRAVFTPEDSPALGLIVSAKDDKLALGASDTVFIDQGALHGVRRGDRFFVFNEKRTVRHPDTYGLMPVAREPIGELTIVDVQADTATAYVQSSQYEFAVGALVGHADVQGASANVLARASTLEALLILVPPCLAQARAAIQAAKAAGASPQALAEAQAALTYAAATFEQAEALLEQGNREQAHQLLEAVESDCLTAQQIAKETNWQLAAQSGDRYTVQLGDTLWGIAGRPAIYRDPFLWPILYQGNRDRLDDPDMIYPRQELAVPRGYSRDEANVARQRARTRGPWRLGDGADPYILEGFQP